ncbi:MAG: DUF1289 domain-containing protein [Verrucomicrobia bacterium]|nr:DUF1289 domain-containing protein [Verrucomicrobiota bacterium]
MSEDKTVCTGCHRSLSEIANRRVLTDAEKIRVVAAAQAREATSESKTTFEQIP